MRGAGAHVALDSFPPFPHTLPMPLELPDPLKTEETALAETPVSTDPIDVAYREWKLEPSPDRMKRVVDLLAPTVDYTLSSMNAGNDPIVRGEATLVAARAVKKYDPSRGASLRTHTTNQLQQMYRIVRNLRDPIQIPERRQFEVYALHRHENDYMDKHGREPSTAELADFSGIPMDRIEKIRRTPTVSSEARYASSADPDSEGDRQDPAIIKPDYLDDAMRYTYLSAAPIDQKIFEHMTGYKGAKELRPADIAAKLNISESQISRRFAKLMSEVQDLESEMEKLYG